MPHTSSRHISTSTVLRRLRQSGLYSQIAARKNNPEEKQQALWVSKHKVKWELEKWKNVHRMHLAKDEIDECYIR